MLLPLLREELDLLPGPTLSDGQPSWTMHDPVRNQFFRIDWPTLEMLQRWEMGDPDLIAEDVCRCTTLTLTHEDVVDVAQFLVQHQLVQVLSTDAACKMTDQLTRMQGTPLKWLLHHYLFFRIPLIKPDAWLARWLPVARWFGSRLFAWTTLLAFAVGSTQVLRRWDVFSASLVDTFNLEGLLAYGVALFVVKFLHELGHAFTAKHYGCRVPAMGVAFLVMWPVAYTDVTESWKLHSHRQRLWIAAAGMATELMMACWMLLAWVLLPPGHWRESAFFLATTSLVATLAINASPLMRFDGYFLLCDLLGQPNLHARSFALARWWLREKLFHLGDPPPEDLTTGWRRFFVAFAWVTWLYRLVVFLGIAVLVYHYFFKVLGIVLFGVEVWFFVMRPVWGEIVAWRERWQDISAAVTDRPVVYLALTALAVLLLPLDATVNAHGMLKPERSLDVVTYQASQIETLPPAIGTRVVAGHALLNMQAPELVEKTQKARIKVAMLERQFSSAGFSSDTVKQQAIFKEQLDSARQELLGLQSESLRLRPVVSFDGVVTDVEPDLFAGEWIPKGMSLVRVIDDRQWIVDTYVDELDLRRIDLGYWGWFVPEAAGLSDIRLQVMSIDRNAIQTLPDAALATTAGGQVMVRVQGNKLFPERTLYRVRLKATGLHEKISTGHLRGRVVILGWPKSLMGDLVGHALAIFIREAGF